MLGLVTAASAREFDADLPLLQRELPDASVVAWDDHTVDWGSFDTVVIRSTWDYHARRDEFLVWARHVESVSTLWNPVSLIEWNTDKRYLIDLAEHGVPIIDSVFIEPGDPVPDDLDLSADIVVKPSVGAGSNGVERPRGDVDAATRHVASLHADGLSVMIQPYVAAIDTEGETGLVYLAGTFSHAFGKSAILTKPIEWEGGLYAEETVEPRRASADQLAVGNLVMSQLPATAYARIDLLPTRSGPAVLEVELTEPSLFLQCDHESPARAAAAFRSLAP